MLTATILKSSLRGNQLIRALKYAQILIQLLVVVHTACIILFMNGFYSQTRRTTIPECTIQRYLLGLGYENEAEFDDAAVYQTLVVWKANMPRMTDWR